jgi:hypothetical protein
MKHLLLLIICLSSLVVSAPAQTSDTFDIATFQAPAGWAKQDKGSGLIYTTSDKQKSTYAMIVLYRSDKSSANPKTDFEMDWRQFAAGIFGVKASPQIEPQKQTDGWTVVTGGATFESELGTSAIIMNTYSGFGRKFSAAAIFNSQEYVPAIDAFASSIVLNKAAPAPQASSSNGNTDSSIVGTWGKQAGAHMTYGDPVAAGMAGYSKDQYAFNSNGTYTFVSKTFRMSYDKIILIRESGIFEISGDTILISPQKSIVQAWSKLDGGDKWGRLLSTQNRSLEKVTYRFTKHYFSGIDQWNLVLQADRPTERDGPFSNNTTFPNAWYYSPISPNNPVIELPR